MRTYRGDKQVSDLLAVVPLSHAARQGDLEHRVALMDLLNTVKDLSHLLGTKDAVLWLQQRFLVLLRDTQQFSIA